jgi:hypothetical protein
MKNFYENDETLPQSSRGVIVKRLIKHFPDRDFDNDDELFEVLTSLVVHCVMRNCYCCPQL